MVRVLPVLGTVAHAQQRQLQQLCEAELRARARVDARLSHADSCMPRTQARLEHGAHRTTHTRERASQALEVQRPQRALDAAQKSLLDETSRPTSPPSNSNSTRCAPQAPAALASASRCPSRAPLPAHLPRTVPPRAQSTTCAVRLCAQAHRRGRGREARLRSRRVHRRAPRPRQVGLREVPDADPGASAGPGNRQGNPHGRPPGAGAGGQVRRPPAAVPPGTIFGRAGLAMSRSTLVRGSAPVAYACSHWSTRSRKRCCSHGRAACRRDTGGDARTGQEEDAHRPTCGRTALASSRP
jgi:hypothetical protein